MNTCEAIPFAAVDDNNDDVTRKVVITVGVAVGVCVLLGCGTAIVARHKHVEQIKVEQLNIIVPNSSASKLSNTSMRKLAPVSIGCAEGEVSGLESLVATENADLQADSEVPLYGVPLWYLCIWVHLYRGLSM